MEISASDIQNLRQIANQLLDIVERVAGDPVDVPEHIAKMVEEKVSKRICLACNQPTPASSKYRKGNDDACYATHRARIRRGDVRESQLVAAGKMTQESRIPGRKAKMDSVDELESDVNAMIERNTKSKKVTKKKSS